MDEMLEYDFGAEGWNAKLEYDRACGAYDGWNADYDAEGEEARMRRKAWRMSLLTIAGCVFAFGLIVMPGLMMRFAKPALGAGHYLKRLNLTPGEELLAQYGPDFFPGNVFTNLKGDSSVACASDCTERDWFIGVQSQMLYHGLEAVAAGKPVRKATREDILQGAGK